MLANWVYDVSARRMGECRSQCFSILSTHENLMRMDAFKNAGN